MRRGVPAALPALAVLLAAAALAFHLEPPSDVAEPDAAAPDPLPRAGDLLERGDITGALGQCAALHAANTVFLDRAGAPAAVQGAAGRLAREAADVRASRAGRTIDAVLPLSRPYADRWGMADHGRPVTAMGEDMRACSP